MKLKNHKVLGKWVEHTILEHQNPKNYSNDAISWIMVSSCMPHTSPLKYDVHGAIGRPFEDLHATHCRPGIGL